MKIESGYKTHFCALTALFTVGNAIIVMPTKPSAKNIIVSFFAAFAISFLFCILSFYVTELLFNIKNPNFQKFLLFSASIFAVLVAVNTFIDICNFFNTVVLPDLQKGVIVLTFALVCLSFGGKLQKNLLKFAVLGLFTVLPLMIVFFLLSFKDLDVSNLSLLQSAPLKNIYKSLLPFFLKCALPVILISVYAHQNFVHSQKKTALCGLSLGFLILFIAVMNASLLFGTELSSKLSYPYASAVSTITIGRLFSRLDGFSYLVYYICSLVKIYVCLSVAHSFASFKKSD